MHVSSVEITRVELMYLIVIDRLTVFSVWRLRQTGVSSNRVGYCINIVLLLKRLPVVEHSRAWLFGYAAFLVYIMCEL